jgi:hypothetical protein
MVFLQWGLRKKMMMFGGYAAKHSLPQAGREVKLTRSLSELNEFPVFSFQMAPWLRMLFCPSGALTRAPDGVAIFFWKLETGNLKLKT